MRIRMFEKLEKSHQEIEFYNQMHWLIQKNIHNFELRLSSSNILSDNIQLFFIIFICH